MESKEEIDVILSEHNLVYNETIEYTKLQIQLFSIFFVFTGVAFKLGYDGAIWAWTLLQIVVPLFLIGSIGLEQNIMMNSIYMIFNEKRINFLSRNKLLFWQKFIGYANMFEEDKSILPFYIPPVLASIVFAIIYSFPCFQIYAYLVDNASRFLFVSSPELEKIYLIGSILIYLLVVLMSLLWRNSIINDITKLVKKANTEMVIENEI